MAAGNAQNHYGVPFCYLLPITFRCSFVRAGGRSSMATRHLGKRIQSVAHRPEPQQHTSASPDNPVLQQLDKVELIQQVEALQEELRLSKAFSQITEAGVNDATLLWQGRNRFLAEKIVPVRLKPVEGESLYPERGENQIIDGDNLAVMTSLLTNFRGGPTRGFDIIYMDPPYNTGEDVFSYNDDYKFNRLRANGGRRRTGLTKFLPPTRRQKNCTATTLRRFRSL